MGGGRILTVSKLTSFLYLAYTSSCDLAHFDFSCLRRLTVTWQRILPASERSEAVLDRIRTIKNTLPGLRRTSRQARATNMTR